MVLMLCFGLAGCGDTKPAAQERETLTEPESKPAAGDVEPVATLSADAPNLILISVDTLRADRLGCYGYDRPTSPTIDQLAAEGVVFDDASTTSPWTLPSHASMLTGLYPRRHGMRLPVHTIGAARRAAKDQGLRTGNYEVSQTTLAQQLAAAGYTTAAFVNFDYVGERYGFDRGFQRFQLIENDAGNPDSSPVGPQAVDWLRKNTGQPFFLFLHFYDIHAPYASLPAYRDQFVHPYDGPVGPTAYVHMGQIIRGEYQPTDADVQFFNDIYDAGIRQFDDVVAKLVAALEQANLLDNTVIVLTADHGEQFMEHGNLSHGENHYQEVMRIPWIMRGPGLPPGKRVSGMVSLVDMVPTLSAIVGLSCPAGLDGIDVAAGWQDGNEALNERYLFAEADIADNLEFEPGTFDVKKAIRDGRYKLHYDTVTEDRELYDLDLDPGENNDLADAEVQIGDRLMERLDQFLSAPATSQSVAPLTAEQIRNLKSVGYLD